MKDDSGCRPCRSNKFRDYESLYDIAEDKLQNLLNHLEESMSFPRNMAKP